MAFQKNWVEKLKRYSTIVLILSFLCAVALGWAPIEAESLTSRTYRLTPFNAVLLYYFFSMACGVFITAAVAGGHALWGNKPWVRFLADQSYAIYLFHFFFIRYFRDTAHLKNFVPALQPYLNYAIILLLVIVLSYIIRTGFERPLNTFRDKLLKNILHDTT